LKLNIQTDFTKFPRATSVLRAGGGRTGPAADSVTLAHDERHLRRRALPLSSGERILVDLLEAVALGNGDRLVLEDGRQVEVVAADEAVLDVRGRDAVHLAELAWHIGNRHLAAAIFPDRILILRDHVIEEMLEGLGATVRAATAPFEPLRGAYSGHGHSHEHHGHGHHEHEHHHEHGDHGHGERDKYGRLPGDPHYGHNHA
jgi:urease accessory protein